MRQMIPDAAATDGSSIPRGELLIMDYYCATESCSYDGKGPYVLSLPPEACIDEHNCAIVFCPYCQSQMVIKRLGRAANDVE